MITSTRIAPCGPRSFAKEHAIWAVGAGQIGASLITVEEERVLRAQAPEISIVNGRQVVLAPPLKLKLHVLFAANYGFRGDAHKYLSHVLTYFQAIRSFTQPEDPDLDPAIDRLTIELLSLT